MPVWDISQKKPPLLSPNWSVAPVEVQSTAVITNQTAVAHSGHSSNTDPLIDHTGEDAIYLALLIILVLGALIIGAVSRHLQGAILFSLFVSALLIAIMIAV